MANIVIIIIIIIKNYNNNPICKVPKCRKTSMELNRYLLIYAIRCTAFVYRVAQNKIPHQTICNIYATSGLI